MSYSGCLAYDVKENKVYFNHEEKVRLGCSLAYLVTRAAGWSDRTFGKSTERGPLPAIHHLKKEVNELLDAPEDDSEYADCLLLLLDAWRRAGRNIHEIVAQTEKKLDVCIQREWLPPDENGVCLHKKD